MTHHDPTLRVCPEDCPCRRRPALRHDTFTRSLDATARMLDNVRAQLLDLHVLAYDRPAAREARVSGGERDWALDTHGDPVARRMWAHLTWTLDETAKDLAEVLHTVAGFLATGPTPTERRDRSADVTALELAQALDAQDRRRTAGDYTPHPTIPQPGARRLPHDPHAELEKLRCAVAKIVDDARRTGDPVVPNRQRLTVAELDAWNRAAYPDALPRGRRRRKRTKEPRR